MPIKPTEGVFDFHPALEQSAELERAEIDIPDSVIDLFEPDVFTDAGSGDVDPLVIPADAAVGTDVAYFISIRVLERRELARHRPWRSLIDAGRGFLFERLVGSHVIELLSKPIEFQLLRAQRGRWRSSGLGLERAMHAFMPTVLLRFAGLDQLRQHSEAHPPGREAGEPRERVGGERHAIIGANELRQSVLFEQSLKHGPCADHRGAL